VKKISRHFWDYEVGKSDWAERHRIDNTPPPDVMARATVLATTVMDVVRDHFGFIKPTSWYRSEAVERHLTYNNGFRDWCRKTQHVYNDRSWPSYFALKSHPLGEAMDFEVDGVDNAELWKWVGENIPEFDQCILEFYRPGDPRSGWVHLSYREGANRGQMFRL